MHIQVFLYLLRILYFDRTLPHNSWKQSLFMRLNDKFSTYCFLSVFHFPLALGSGGWVLRSPESHMYGSLPCSHSPQPVTHTTVHQSPSRSGCGHGSTLPSLSPIHPSPILLSVIPLTRVAGKRRCFQTAGITHPR